jgi:hypothetical protein
VEFIHDFGLISVSVYDRFLGALVTGGFVFLRFSIDNTEALSGDKLDNSPHKPA